MATYNLEGFIDNPEEEKARAATAAAAKREKELKARAAAAASKAKQQQPQRQQASSVETPAQAAATAQRQEKPQGLMSAIGGAIDNAISGDWVSDGLNAVAAGVNQITPDGFPTKGITQALDDNIRSSDELDALVAQRHKAVEQDGSLIQRGLVGTEQNLEALYAGSKAGVMLPATIAARLMNQEASWSNAPAQIKDSPVGKTIFEVAQVIVPTLLTGGVAAGYGLSATGVGGTALVGESLLETAPQDSAEDLVAGRFLSQKMGELADYLGYDGAQLTRDLIEGKKPEAQAMVAVAGLFQNLGINWGANKLFNAIGAKFGKQPEALLNSGEDVTAKTAKVLGKDEKVVVKALDDTNTPPYSPDFEPHQVETIDSSVPVGKPSKPDGYISDESLVAESLRKSGLGEDGLSAADRKYFTNWSAISDSLSLQNALKDATKTLRKLKDYPDDLKLAMTRATAWWNYNKGLIDENLDGVALNFSQTMVEPLKSKQGVVALLDGKLPVEKLLREYTNVSEEGYIAAALMGEELGIRIQKVARQAMNLENASSPIDFTKSIENLLELQDKANLFLIPLRRGKRKWAVEGTLQQRKQIESIRDADIQGAIKKADPSKYDAPARSFEVQRLDEADTGFTIREIWERYKEGDEGAGQTLKTYLSAIAYADPAKAVQQVDNLSKLLADQLAKGNADAGAQLFYGFMLSRIATQTASAASNIARLVGEPIGAIISGEKAYGIGQLVGGLQATQDAFKAGMRAFKENRSIVGGAKIDAAVYDLKLRQTKLDELYKGYQQQLIKEGGNKAKEFAASNQYWLQTLGNNPVVSVGNRFLQAQDEMAKVLFASQVATGRAYKQAVAEGFTKPQDIQRLVNEQFRSIFEKGIKTGRIIDADVLDGAKGLTFQSDIISGDDANFIDNAFSGIKEAADNSGYWKFFTPFTRVSYNILETAGRYEPTGMFRNQVPRYKAILNGEMGDVAQLQLKSQIAMGRAWTSLVVGAAMFGYTTGNNSGSMPKTSFIIPDGKGGYTALPYNKLEPFATITAVITDAVNGLRDDVISEGQYDRFMKEMLYSLAMATFDKSFMSGMTQMSAMFDVNNFGEGTATGAANIAGSAAPAIVRMVGDWVNPYQSVSTDTDNVGRTLWAKFAQRTIGGATNPTLFDEMTGLPIPKTTTIGSADNWWAATAGSIFNEFAWAGRVKGGKLDPIRKKLDELNFKQDNGTSIRTFEGIPLSLEQQSRMSKAIHEQGSLRTRLELYFNSDVFKSKQQKYKAFRWDNNLGNQGGGTRANSYLQDIHQDIRAIRREAKEMAAKHLIQTDPDFARKYQAAKTLNIPQQQGNPNGWEGLLSWANK